MNRPWGDDGAANTAELRIPSGVDPSRPELVHQAFLDAGIFALPTCRACGRAHFSPRVLCPHCGSMLLGWVRTRGAAVIYSVSVVYSRREEPHAVVLADLPEGVRIMSSVVDCAASDVWIGQRVQLRVTELDGVAVPVCEAAGPS